MSRPFPIRLNYYPTTSVHRHVNCELHHKCLDKAERKNWKNFSCVSCVIFKKHKKEEAKKNEFRRRVLEHKIADV